MRSTHYYVIVKPFTRLSVTTAGNTYVGLHIDPDKECSRILCDNDVVRDIMTLFMGEEIGTTHELEGGIVWDGHPPWDDFRYLNLDMQVISQTGEMTTLRVLKAQVDGTYQ